MIIGASYDINATSVAARPKTLIEMSLSVPVPGVLVETIADVSDIQATSAAPPEKSADIAYVAFSNPKFDPVIVIVANPTAGTLAGEADSTIGPRKAKGSTCPEPFV